MIDKWIDNNYIINEWMNNYNNNMIIINNIIDKWWINKRRNP